MTKLKKGDLVWVAAHMGGSITAQQVRIKSAGDSLVTITERIMASGFNSKLPRDRVFSTSEDAVLVVRGSLRLEAAEHEQKARDLRKLADSEPEIVAAKK